MPQNDLDELIGRTTDGLSRAARLLAVVDAIKTAVAAKDDVGEHAAHATARQLWEEMSQDERWDVSRPLGLKFGELSETYVRAAGFLSAQRAAAEAKDKAARAACYLEIFAAIRLSIEANDRRGESDGWTMLRSLWDDMPDTERWEAALGGSNTFPPLADLYAMQKRRDDRETARATRETQTSISQWAEATFGPSGSNARAVARANREMSELLEHVTADDQHPEAAEEIADIMIVLYRVATRLGVDLHDQIDRKMATNRARKWQLDGTGHGYHVKESGE